ncbi:APC family permease [Capilliphycus salinus ALCB114379]|uniref:APC family permease n=1 Tax=Capilliphycus salinus TaxID=2768948 RepID=UPI0039A4E38C
MSASQHSPQQLKRELGWFGATIMGLGSVIGVGIFVSLGLAAGLSGYGVIGALVVAGILQIANSLNLAQLAASHPVSGGIYEYGYKYLNSWFGFTGGWMYLLGKTAVAATAALGFSSYLIKSLGVSQSFLVPIAELAVLGLTAVVLGGMRRSKAATTVILSITLFALFFLIIAGGVVLSQKGFLPVELAEIDFKIGLKNFLESVALLFVAYNGPARITMLGEEITEPRKNIPKAVLITLGITTIIYMGVAIVSLGTIGAEALGIASEEAAPLEIVAASLGIPGAKTLLAIGAITATLSVLLSIILGLSRLLLAMGRRGDMPRLIAQLNSAGTTPYWAVIFISIAVGLLVLTGDVKTTWSLSAFGSLWRCGIVGLAALRLSDEQRLYPVWMSLFALFSGLFLAFWIEWQVWLIGLGLIGVGLVWHFVASKLKERESLAQTSSD